MIRVGVIGATGYAGAELVRILQDHPEVELTSVTSRQYAGKPFSQVFPAMNHIIGLTCEEYEPASFSKSVDIAFLALPHQLSMSIAPGLVANGKKVIDLSADFRFRDISLYERVYQKHSAPQLSEQSVYGLCEVNSEQIKKADLIGNPGCYPTSILLPLVPLVENKLIETHSLIADAKSGVSGAGRSVSLGTHFCEVNEGFKAYKVASHRHTPEMEETLSLKAGLPVQLTFVPHLVPMTRGMLSTIYANLSDSVSEKDICDCLLAYYKDKPFVRVRPAGEMPNVSYVRGTNYCDIGIHVEEKTRRVILVSVIDNLIKGAAGQAVQNMNIMLGFDETTGLGRTPFPV